MKSSLAQLKEEVGQNKPRHGHYRHAIVTDASTSGLGLMYPTEYGSILTNGIREPYQQLGAIGDYRDVEAFEDGAEVGMGSDG